MIWLHTTVDNIVTNFNVSATLNVYRNFCFENLVYLDTPQAIKPLLNCETDIVQELPFMLISILFLIKWFIIRKLLLTEVKQLKNLSMGKGGFVSCALQCFQSVTITLTITHIKITLMCRTRKSDAQKGPFCQSMMSRRIGKFLYKKKRKSKQQIWRYPKSINIL